MKNVINSLSLDLLLSNLTEVLLMIKSHMSNQKATYFLDHVVAWVHVTNEYRYILTSTKPIATRFNRVMACNEESPSSMSFDHVTMCSHVTNQKRFISNPTSVMATPNLTGWYLMTWSYHPKCHISLRSGCQIRSHDKIKTLPQETYGYQTWHVIGFC